MFKQLVCMGIQTN